MAAPINLLVIEDRIIQTMLGDPRFLAAIPCLSPQAQALKDVPKRCGSCGAKRANARGKILQQVRQCIGSLPANKKVELKTLLNAKRLRLIAPNGRGKSIVLTF